MAKQQSSKKRTQVKALPAAKKELSAKEAKKVKGGVSTGWDILILAKGDGSVKPKA